MKEKKPTCQKKSVGFDLKLKIIDEVCNGQISVNHASIKYQVGRNAIYYWLQKFATLEQKKKGMAKKDEIKKLKERNQKKKSLEKTVVLYKEYKKLYENFEEAKTLVTDEKDPEMLDLPMLRDLKTSLLQKNEPL